MASNEVDLILQAETTVDSLEKKALEEANQILLQSQKESELAAKALIAKSIEQQNIMLANVQQQIALSQDQARTETQSIIDKLILQAEKKKDQAILKCITLLTERG